MRWDPTPIVPGPEATTGMPTGSVEQAVAIRTRAVIRVRRMGRGYPTRVGVSAGTLWPMATLTDPAAAPTGLGAVVRSYVALTKPRIIELLLVTTVPPMVLAAGGWPGWRLVTATLVGGTLSAAGANTLNSVIDRDIDEIMRRTRRRPIVRAHISVIAATVFGILLGLAGLVLLWIEATPLAAMLSTGALLFYVFVYTLGLKRKTPQNIVIGGAAGAAPVLVGWAAVTGSLDLAAWVLFAIVFTWTPPHFWALAIKYKDDYQAAGIPMLPVVRGVDVASGQSLVYSGSAVLFSLALVRVADMGWIYLVSAAVLGGWLIVEGVRLLRDPARAMAMFRFSTIYLAALFGAVWLDVVV